MRVVLVGYLATYYVLIALAVATAWQSGLIDDLHQGWTLMAIAAALALGAVLAIASHDRERSAHDGMSRGDRPATPTRDRQEGMRRHSR